MIEVSAMSRVTRMNAIVVGGDRIGSHGMAPDGVGDDRAEGDRPDGRGQEAEERDRDLDGGRKRCGSSTRR